MFANPEAYDLVTGFEVDHTAGFPVHDVLRMKLKSRGTSKRVTVRKKTKSLHEIPMKALADRFLEQNRISRKEQQDREVKEDEERRVRYDGDDDKPGCWERKLNCDDKRAEDKRSMWPSFQDSGEDGEEAEDDEDHVDDDIFTEEQIHEVKKELHQVMDSKIMATKPRLMSMLENGDTGTFIRTLSNVLEDSFISFGQVSVKDADRYRGHGKVEIEEKNVPVSGAFDKHLEEMKGNCKNREEERISLQLRRLVAIKDACKCLHSVKDRKEKWTEALSREVMCNTARFIKHTNGKNPIEKEGADYLKTCGNSVHHNMFKLTKLVKDYERALGRLRRENISKIGRSIQSQLEGKKSQKRITRLLKGPSGQPMRFLQRPADRDGFGKVTTDETEVDQIARDAWAKVYEGNVIHMKQHVKMFMQKYDEHIYKADKMTIEELRWEDVKKACLKDIDSSGGLDVWTKRAFHWISDEGFKLLTEWMKAIERTRRWPSDQCKARAVFLSKSDNASADPMDDRILKITSTLYRVWASVRMADLEDWIKGWADKAMFAGVPGGGAEEAWYLTQLDFELKRLGGMQITPMQYACRQDPMYMCVYIFSYSCDGKLCSP